MQRRLRGIYGAHEGAVYVLGEETRIGRAADAHVQVAHAEVSRHHAKIVREADGAYYLVDLSSANGTYLNGERVRRGRLEPGDAIGVHDNEFLFEVQAVGEADAVTSACFDSKARTLEALRQTGKQTKMAHAHKEVRVVMTRTRFGTTTRVLKTARLYDPRREAIPYAPHYPPPPAPEKEVVDLPVVPARPAPRNDFSGDAAGAGPTKPMSIPMPGPGPGPLRDPARVHAGLNLLREILDYRDLRIRYLRGDAMQGDARARFTLLQSRMQNSLASLDLDSTRRFQRYACSLPAVLTRHDGQDSRILGVEVEDLGAGGACLQLLDNGIRPGDEVTLTIDLSPLEEAARSVTLRSKVAWTRRDNARAGLAFAGAPHFV